MVLRRARSSRNKQATSAPSVNEREPDASDKETEHDIKATDAAGDGTENVSLKGRSSVTKIKGPKKKTSPIWKHFTEVLSEEKVDGMVVLKRAAECNYCEDVLSAESKQEFCEINLKLMEWNKSRENFILSMANSMKAKFDKYWGVSNVALAVACFLDPRYKMKVVEFYYSEMSDDYGFNDMYEFKKIVQNFYDSYSFMYSASETSSVQNSQARTARTSQCYVDLNEEPKRKRMSLFLRDNTETSHELSDLDQYCNEPLLSWKEGEYIDILSWWKTHGVKYPILTRMARDVLAIPAMTVASKSAFSFGRRIVHKYRSRLDPQVVEALVCTKDWISASRQVAPADDGDNIMDLEDEEN